MACVKTSESEYLTVYSLNNPVELTALHLINPKRYPYILESSAEAENILSDDSVSANQHARFDILFAYPQESLTLYSDNTIEAVSAVLNEALEFEPSNDFLSNLDTVWQSQKQTYLLPDIDLPFSGGWFAFLGYELAAQIERRLNLPRSHDKTITARLIRIPIAIIIDKHLGTQFIIAEPDYKKRINDVIHDIESIQQKLEPLDHLNIKLVEEESARYINSISKIKDYIVEGDVFQVNLSRLWKAESINQSSSLTLYNALKKSNPAPFSAYVDFGDFKIISSSPERLVKACNGFVQTRPIAGTRARNNETSEDIRNLKELIAHPKERAEHIMLIDLERNDLGRICEAGSIHVDELMALESFKHVHHIVSNVTGRLKNDITPGDVIRAVFPGGTITGCPKERCMQIIAELENEYRGAYTGSVGYINHDGSLDFNILIRTFEINDKTLTLRAGAGIVADSVAENELIETRTKAKGLLEAVM